MSAVEALIMPEVEIYGRDWFFTVSGATSGIILVTDSEDSTRSVVIMAYIKVPMPESGTVTVDLPANPGETHTDLENQGCDFLIATGLGKRYT